MSAKTYRELAEEHATEANKDLNTTISQGDARARLDVRMLLMATAQASAQTAQAYALLAIHDLMVANNKPLRRQM